MHRAWGCYTLARMKSPLPSRARLAVCSWSLEPTSPRDLVEKVRACGLTAVQLALDPVRRGEWGEAETIEALRAAEIDIVSGMMAPAGEDYSTLETIRETGGVRPEATWPENRRASEENAALAERLGLPLVTLHAGCAPRERDGFVSRLREVCGLFMSRGVRVAFETGQETADGMLGLVDQLRDLRVAVNFDPGNVILYGQGDPIEAMRTLLPRIAQCHMKDATATRVPGEWGEEVRAGAGEVDWRRFFELHAAHAPSVDVVIEREAGASRVEDVCAAVDIARNSLEVWA